MRGLLLSIFNCTRGSTPVEYALIAGLMTVIIVLGVTNIGTGLLGFYDEVAQAVGP